MLSKFKISTKVYLLGLSQLLLLVIMGGVAINQMAKIGVELVDIAEEDIPLSRAVTKITEHQLEQAIIFERALFQVLLAEQNIEGANSHFNERKAEVAELSGKIKKEIEETQAFVSRAINKVHSQKGKNKFTYVASELQNIAQLYSKVMEQLTKVLALASTGQKELMIAQADSVKGLEDDLEQKLVDLLAEIQRFTLEASLQAEQDEQSGIKWIIGAFVIALLLGIILPYIISRSITYPINYLVERLKEVADGDGDLTVSLDEKAADETGDVARAFNKFMGVLRTLIANTNSQAEVLAESAQTAMTIMRETVENVDKQRVETEMVATAVTEMSATTQDVARSASHAAEVTERVRMRVVEGQQGAQDTQDIIKRLSDEVTEAGEVIKNLVDETNNIGSVLESIQGIAAQTSLLALNAAIEAARAGESGRGFAVVADEVRSLAQRTQTSTVDIQDLVERLQSEASNAVTSMRKGSESAKLCLNKSSDTSNTFLDASKAVGEISDLNIQIATAAEEQSAVAEEINRNLLNISNLAQTTAQGAEATAQANSTIAKRVTELQVNLSVFMI